MKPYPLLFEPLLKPRVWGGRTLAAYGKTLPAGVAIGESWEVADLPESIPEGRSRIVNGELAGLTLREAIAQQREMIMGDAKLSPEGGFPLLIKLLDAQQNLSVQVHPDESYAARHQGAHLKSEAWVIVQAAKGAVIYKGVKPEVTAEEFAQHIQDHRVVDDLIPVPVKAGDCHYLPSGTCHALGAGILVAEVQTPSDTTFRIYDWGRTGGRTGAGRELHIEQALECMRFGAPDKPPRRNKPIRVEGVQTTVLSETEFFALERVETKGRIGRFNLVLSGLPEVWMLLGGGARLEMPSAPVLELRPGTTVLLPAALESAVVAEIEPRSWLLRIRLPSPLKGMLA